LTLTQTAATAQRLDMSGFTPRRLAGLSNTEIARLRIHVGNRSEEAGDLFGIRGTPGERLTIVPAAKNLDELGAGMDYGELRVEGHAGRRAARALAGGSVVIAGNAGDEAGTGMTGGRLLIQGDTGERLGGPQIGDTRGMGGGLIRVGGNAGDRAGERLRRGLILIGGDAGDYCGTGLIAGTLAVLGQAGRMVGSGMRRGTLLLSGAPISLPSTFNDNGAHHLSFVPLLLAQLGELTELPTAFAARANEVHRFVGDLSEGGLGEVILPIG
jgi:formylmethanofuran dehydrogenase subunit C